MGVILRTIKYGESRTRAYLIASLVLLVAGLGAISAGSLMGLWPIALIGGVVTVADVIVFAMRRFTEVDSEIPQKAGNNARSSSRTELHRRRKKTGSNDSDAEGKKNRHKKVRKRKQAVKSKVADYQGDAEMTDNTDDRRNSVQQNATSQGAGESKRPPIDTVPVTELLNSTEASTLAMLKSRFKSIKSAEKSAQPGGTQTADTTQEHAAPPVHKPHTYVNRHPDGTEEEVEIEHYHKPMELRLNNTRSKEQQRIVDEALERRARGGVIAGHEESGPVDKLREEGIDEDYRRTGSADQLQGSSVQGHKRAERYENRIESNVNDKIMKTRKSFFSRKTDRFADENADADDPGMTAEEERRRLFARRHAEEPQDEDDEPVEAAKPAGGVLRGQSANGEYLVKYTGDQVKKLLKENKAGRDSTAVIIDYAVREDIARTPAFCWVKGNEVCFLVLEAEERVITMPMYKFLKVTYDHNVPEKNMKAYENIKKSMGAYPMFADVMPTFTREGGQLGTTGYTKNLYVLGGDIAITPRSMRELNRKFKFEYKIFDSFNLREKYSDYFKRAYEQRVLWTDNVIAQPEFQSAIRDVLQSMVDDDNVSTYEFDDDFEMMIKYRLVTKEYGDFFRQKKRENFR